MQRNHLILFAVMLLLAMMAIQSCGKGDSDDDTASAIPSVKLDCNGSSCI